MSRTVTKASSSAYQMLFSRTMTVLLAMVGTSYLGTMLTWDWIPTAGQFWTLAIVWLASIFGVTFVAGKQNNPVAIVPATLFSFLGGCLTGPALAMYTETLGAAQVSFALALCGAILVICGCISYVANFAYAKLESFLMFGLHGS